MSLVPADRPVFVLGERAAAVQLVRTLGDTASLCAMPPIRLLADLVMAVDRCAGKTPALDPARWYGDVQAAQRRATGKGRTVEFSGLPILRLCRLFPTAQFVIVRATTRALPPSRRLPAQGVEKIFEVDSAEVTAPETLAGVLTFLGETGEALELDLTEVVHKGGRT